MTALTQVGKRIGNAFGSDLARLVALDALVETIGRELDLDAGNIWGQGVLHTRLVPSRRKRHELAPEHRRSLENAVDERQHVGMAAEVVRQQYDVVGITGMHRIDMPPVDRNVRAAEPVNRLLRIADGAQPASTRPCELLYHVDLHLVSVLELIDHDELELVGVLCRDARMAGNCIRRHHQKVVVVEHSFQTLVGGKTPLRLARKFHERAQVRGRGGKPQLHDAHARHLEGRCNLLLVIGAPGLLRVGKRV